MRPYILVGMPLVGKTTIGEALSKELRCPFIDLDEYITKAENLSPKDILINYGEHVFRECEFESVSEILNNNRKKKLVIASGGGAFCYKKIFDLVKEKAISIYLQEDIDILTSRFEQHAMDRPLIEKKEDLNDLFEKRKRLYERADYVIECENQPSGAIVQKIIQIIS